MRNRQNLQAVTWNMDPKQVVFLSSIGAHVLLIALHIPLAQGKVKPNQLYGLRIRQTLENEEVWYVANARAARVIIGAAAILMSLSVATLVLPAEAYAVVNVSLLLVTVVWWCIDSVRYASKISHSRN